MEEFSMPQSILQIVSEKGFDGLREIMQMLFNEAMKITSDQCRYGGNVHSWCYDPRGYGNLGKDVRS